MITTEPQIQAQNPNAQQDSAKDGRDQGDLVID